MTSHSEFFLKIISYSYSGYLDSDERQHLPVSHPTGAGLCSRFLERKTPRILCGFKGGQVTLPTHAVLDSASAWFPLSTASTSTSSQFAGHVVEEIFYTVPLVRFSCLLPPTWYIQAFPIVAPP